MTTRTQVHTETYRDRLIVIDRVETDSGSLSWLDHSIDGRVWRTPRGDLPVLVKKLRKVVDDWIADDAIADRVAAVIMNEDHMTRTERDRLQPAGALDLDAVAWVHAFGARRQGIVTKLTRTRVEIAYATASNPGVIRRATVPAGEVWVSA